MAYCVCTEYTKIEENKKGLKLWAWLYDWYGRVGKQCIWHSCIVNLLLFNIFLKIFFDNAVKNYQVTAGSYMHKIRLTHPIARGESLSTRDRQ